MTDAVMIVNEQKVKLKRNRHDLLQSTANITLRVPQVNY